MYIIKYIICFWDIFIFGFRFFFSSFLSRTLHDLWQYVNNILDILLHVNNPSGNNILDFCEGNELIPFHANQQEVADSASVAYKRVFNSSPVEFLSIAHIIERKLVHASLVLGEQS